MISRTIEVHNRDADCDHSEHEGQVCEPFVAIVMEYGNGGWFNTGLVFRETTPELAFSKTLAAARTLFPNNF